MSIPVGATHELEERIWHKPLPEIIDGKFYDLVGCDGATGQVRFKLFRKPAQEIRDGIRSCENWKLHVFVYLCK